MKTVGEPVKRWFGFTRRERNSSFILLLIIIIIIVLRYTVPERNISIEDISADIQGIGSSSEIITGDIFPSDQPVYFDPNSASYEILIKAGLASKEANTLIKYRNNGGKFRIPSDIKKIYGIEEGHADKLIPFIEFATETTELVRVKSDRQQQPFIEINSCDSALLVTLPGIGPVLSARIIRYRHLLGGFARIDQIKEVYGLPEETYDLIRGRLIVDTTAISRIYINSADYRELTRLPYFEKYEVTAIMKYRELKGRITGIAELTENRLITEEKVNKVRPYLNFE